MKIYTLLSVILIVFFLWGCGSKSSDPGGGDTPTDVYITANTSVTIPANMMNSINSVWNSVTGATIKIGEYPAGSGFYDPNIGFSKDVTLKAIVKDDTLYLYVKWPDRSQNQRYNRLRLTTTSAPWGTMINEGEDVFFLILDAGNNGTEKADCATMCHVVGSDTLHYTSGGGNAEVWKWRAGTTAPAFMADDCWWDGAGTGYDYPDADDNFVYRDNTQMLPSIRPFFSHTTEGDYIGDFLFTYDTTTFVPFMSGGNWEDGDEVPGFVIDSMFHDTVSTPDSRWDIISYSNYSEVAEAWEVVLKRALNTGNAGDDVDLSAVDTVQATIAVNHNYPANSPHRHSGSKPFYIILNP